MTTSTIQEVPTQPTNEQSEGGSELIIVLALVIGLAVWMKKRRSKRVPGSLV